MNSFLLSSKYADCRKTLSAGRRTWDTTHMSFSYPSPTRDLMTRSEDFNISNLGTNSKSLTGRIYMDVMEFCNQLTEIERFKKVVGQRKDILYIGSTYYGFSEHQLQFPETIYTICQLKGDLRDALIEIEYINSKIEYHIKTNRMLEKEVISLKQHLMSKDDHICKLPNSFSRFNLLSESKVIRDERSKLLDVEWKIREYQQKIIDLERKNKINDEQLQIEKEKCSKCLKESQMIKRNSEISITSLQTTNRELERKISHCNITTKFLEYELKKHQAFSNACKFNSSEGPTGVKQSIQKENEYVLESENEKLLKAKQLECQEQVQQISDLKKQLKDTSQKLRNKEEELRLIKTTKQHEANDFKEEYSHLKIRLKNQEDELTEMKKDLRVKIEDKDRQLVQQREKHQEALKQLQKRDNEFIKMKDSQKNEIQHLKNELNASKKAVSKLESSIQSKTFERKTNEAKIDADQWREIEELKKQLKNAHSKLHETEIGLTETKSRLSKVMGDRLTNNNPNITDLNDRNRPTKLAEKYSELYDNQWTDAFDVLEKHYQAEEYVIDTLLQIMQDVMAFCCERANLQMKNLGIELLLACKDGDGEVAADARTLLKECRNAVGLTTVGNLQKIQEPQVAFAPIPKKGANFDTDFYQSYTTSGPKVQFVVWPPLILHKGGTILAKGVAQGFWKTAAS